MYFFGFSKYSRGISLDRVNSYLDICLAVSVSFYTNGFAAGYSKNIKSVFI